MIALYHSVLKDRSNSNVFRSFCDNFIGRDKVDLVLDLPFQIVRILLQDVKSRVASAMLETAYYTYDGDENLAELDVESLISFVKLERITTCVLRCCELLTLSLNTYYLLSSCDVSKELVDRDEISCVEDTLANNLVQVSFALADGKWEIWSCVEDLLCSVLAHPSLSDGTLPIDDFITVVWSIRRLCLLGAQLCVGLSTTSCTLSR